MDYNYAFRAIMNAQASVMIITFIVVITFALYLLGSIGLMKIANNLGHPNPWLAFIPVANMYILGKMTFKEVWLTWTLVILDIANFAFPFTNLLVPSNFVDFALVTSIFRALLFILNCIALYKLYEKISDKAIIMTIFTILTLGLISPIFLFAIRNNSTREQVQ